jgi:hypothetical protein
VPTKNPAWSAEQVADWYLLNQGKIKWGAVIGGWAGAFMMPILAVVAYQMARVEGGWKIWSVLSLVSGALMSLFLMLPPMFWGVAAYTAPRKDPEVTTLMHELATLTLTTTDQYYIFLWVANKTVKTTMSPKIRIQIPGSPGTCLVGAVVSGCGPPVGSVSTASVIVAYDPSDAGPLRAVLEIVRLNIMDWPASGQTIY